MKILLILAKNLRKIVPYFTWKLELASIILWLIVGKKYFKSFMKRNRISLKKANMISSARKSANSNSFIVFGFYDTLEKVMSENNFFPRKYEI